MIDWDELIGDAVPPAEQPEEQPEAQEEPEGFHVTDDRGAEWCMKIIREANAEKAKWTDFYQAQLKKICDREDSRIAYMEAKLAEYFARIPHKVTKTQESYQLPSGKLIVKRQGPEVTRDDEAIMGWLYENSQRPEEYINIKETLNWAKLKKCLKVSGDRMTTDDGEVIPGITVTERPDKFVVEV